MNIHPGLRTIVIGLLALFLGGNGWANVRGRALLVDASNRTKPGNLVLCRIAGDERKMETLVEGPVMDARFSPDGKQIVYGIDGRIKTMNLETRTTTDICECTTNLTYFTWTTDNKIIWSDGKDLREIYSVDIATKEKKLVHKGNGGRSTISSDGKRAAWVLPPVCSVIGGKTWRYMGGCGGAVSPSGKYLTSNLTTGHKLMGIFTFGDEGPSEKPVASVVALSNHAINGFYFGRTDEWVCYTVEAPENISPIAYIAYWPTDDHIEIAKKLCIKDFFDETDVLPAGAELEKITICADGAFNTPLTNLVVNVGLAQPFKVVGHYRTTDGVFTPRLRDGITWKTDTSKVAMSAAACKGVAESPRVTTVAAFKDKTCSLDVKVLPALTGDGFKAEYFGDAGFATNLLTRTDPCIDFRWEGNASPDKAINGRKPWSARWTGNLDVQVDGDYTFYFLQGEGNDWFAKGDASDNGIGYGVWVDGRLAISRTKDWNIGWVKPKPSAPISLKKGMHAIKVTTIDRSAQPVVAQLYWSGPDVKMSLLGGGYIHSGVTAGTQVKWTRERENDENWNPNTHICGGHPAAWIGHRFQQSGRRARPCAAGRCLQSHQAGQSGAVPDCRR